MRTIELKEASGLTMQQLLAMPDDEVAELAAKHERKAYYPPESAFKAVKGVEVSIDIRNTWGVTSRIERGLSPEGLGVSKSGGFIS